MPASLSNTCFDDISGPVRSASGSSAKATSSATWRQRKEGTSFSSTVFSRAGMPALRKYFCAMTSAATWLHAVGTSMPSSENTVEPSGLRISLLVARNAIDA